jgi:membrane protease YdiL (CAAX protease family)
MLSRLRERGASMRLGVILVMIALAAGIMTTSKRPGRLPQSDWYQLSRQRLLQADLTYRVGVYLSLALPDEALPGFGNAHQLQERAIAEYERVALTGRPNPVALHRLGIIYGARGYYEQARQVLNRAASLDEEHARLFFDLAAMFVPTEQLRPLDPAAMQRVRQQEQWLTAIALPTYYDRLQQPQIAAQYRGWAQSLSRQFGLRVVILFAVYGSLGLVGLGILLVAIVRWGFFVHASRPPRPAVIVPWGPLDALEVVAVLYLAVVASGVAVGLLLNRLPGLPDTVHVAIVAVQYLLATVGVLLLALRRVGGAQRRRLSTLGLRARHLSWQIAQGVGGYAVLVVALVSLTAVLPGDSPLGAGLLQTGERLLGGAHSTPARIMLFLLVCVAAPILEEMIFRGFVYSGLRRRAGVTGAVLTSAVLFGLVHMNPAALLPITLIGIVLAVLYERNLSLVPSIICHALHNTLVFFLALLTV